MEKDLKTLERELEILQEQIELAKKQPQFEVGRWYKATDSKFLIYLTKYGSSNRRENDTIK